MNEVNEYLNQPFLTILTELWLSFNSKPRIPWKDVHVIIDMSVSAFSVVVLILSHMSHSTINMAYISLMAVALTADILFENN